jgi:hypothetical protein
MLFCLGLHRNAGLSWELVERRLLIKASFRPHKQGAWNFKLEIIGRVKECNTHFSQE